MSDKNKRISDDQDKKIGNLIDELAEMRSRLDDATIVFQQLKIYTGRYHVPTRTLLFPPETAKVFGIEPVYRNFPEQYIIEGHVHGNAEQFIEFYESICRGESHGRNSTEIRLYNGEFRLFNRQFTTVFDANGNPNYGILSLIDITEQREQVLAAQKWDYISRSLKADNIHYYDYNMSQDILEAIDGNSPSIYPDQNDRTFTGVAHYVANTIIHPDDRDEYLRVFSVKNLLERFERGETEIITEHRRIDKDGGYFHAQGVIQLYADPFNGDVLSVVVIKNMEASIAQWKSKLHAEARDALNDSIPGGIVFSYNTPGRPFYSVNEGLLDYLGYADRKELEQATDGFAQQIVHPDDRRRLETEINRAVQENRQFRVDHRVLKKDGTIMWVVHRGRNSIDHEGKNIIISVLADVTENVQLQMELEEKAGALEAKNLELQTLTENVPGGVSVMRLDGKLSLVYANPTFYEMHGYTPKQAREELNLEWIRTIHPEDVEAAVNAGIQARDSGQNRFEHELRVVKRDGSFIWTMIRGTIIENNGESFIHSVTLDITARKLYEEIRKKHEEALRDAAYAAEEATRMKSVFLANMSHEIRTPMNGVVGFAELALDDDSLSEKTRTYLSKIKLSAAGLLEIINDILDISKIEAGRMELDRTEFSLHDVFKQCETISSIRAEEKGVMLYFYSEPDLWKMLIGDPTKLRQVLLNLLSNAIKFTNRGMVKLVATIEELAEDEVKINFEVKDSGIGLLPEQIEKIFEPFAQADTGTTRRFGGTGLGLPITKSMVELMGGTLKAESTPGLGSKFSFTLPFGIADRAVNLDEELVKPIQELRKPIFEGEVLVCEDNPINQDVICDHLSKVGLQSVIAANGKVGVDMVKGRMQTGKPFDLILMDIHMPIMDGLEATRSIIRLGDKTPIVALTANAMEKDRSIYLANGMSEYLAKPFQTQELWNCLMKFLTPVSMVNIETSNTSGKKSPPPSENSIFDQKIAMERAGGDVDLYNRVRTNFAKRNRDTYEEIRDLLRGNCIRQAHQVAHTLKGTSGLLGATRLSSAAREVEFALVDGESKVTQMQLEELRVALDEVMEELENTQISADENKTEEKTEQILERATALALLDELKPLLKSASGESGDYLERIREILGPLGDEAEMLIQQIDDYEFDDAEETLKQIRNRLG